ncbi:hypothetical protein L0222_22170 [bacterium]|nr:hypothetical protein [bacterium]MCI0601965.1 hypothetical protein [bacterium]
MAPEFGEVFANGNSEAAIAALSALIEAGIQPTNLTCLDHTIEKKGNFVLAFTVQDYVYQHGAADERSLLDCYRQQIKIKDQKAGLEWLKARVPSNDRNRFCLNAIQDQEFALLWDFIQQPTADNDEIVWLMRAIACARKNGNDPHKKELLQYYTRTDTDFHHKMGQYLMGIISENESLDLATDPSKKAAVSYAIAVKAHGQNRYEDASDWYRISVETGVEKEVWFKFACDALFRWSQSGRGLWKAAEEKL